MCSPYGIVTVGTDVSAYRVLRAWTERGGVIRLGRPLGEEKLPMACALN